MNSPGSLLVIGCGYLGKEIARAWQHEGGVVYGTTRTPEELKDLEKRGIHPIVFNTELSNQTFPWPPVDYVVISVAADGSDPKSYETTYGSAVQKIVNSLLSRRSIKRVIYTSSVGIYSQENGDWVNEQSPLMLVSHREKALYQAEQSVLNAPFPSMILRLGGIYGPNRNRISAVQQKSALENPDHYVNLIHVVDAAHSCLFLLNLPVNKEIVIGVDSCPVRRGELVAHIAKRLHIDIPPTKGNSPFSAGVRNKRCSNKKLKKLGYKFIFPTYRAGYNNLIAAERKNEIDA